MALIILVLSGLSLEKMKIIRFYNFSHCRESPRERRTELWGARIGELAVETRTAPGEARGMYILVRKLGTLNLTSLQLLGHQSLSVCVPLCGHPCACVCSRTCMHVHVCTYMYAHVHVCMYMCAGKLKKGKQSHCCDSHRERINSSSCK